MKAVTWLAAGRNQTVCAAAAEVAPDLGFIALWLIPGLADDFCTGAGRLGQPHRAALRGLVWTETRLVQSPQQFS